MSECFYHIWQFTHKHHNTFFLYISFPKKALTPRNAFKTRRFAQSGELMPLLAVLTDNRLLEGHTYLESHPTLAGERVSGSPTWGQTVAFTLASRRLTLHGKRTWRAGVADRRASRSVATLTAPAVRIRGWRWWRRRRRKKKEQADANAHKPNTFTVFPDCTRRPSSLICNPRALSLKSNSKARAQKRRNAAKNMKIQEAFIGSEAKWRL